MMQSERGDDGGGSDEMRQNRRLKPLQGDQQQQPPPQPQKCPRCESLNTKFCYYNNYSLSQPRYFCKTCRRYWTQGGTLRNVPVGGGCRKGKRTKTSSSGESSSSQPNPPQNYTAPQTMGTSSSAITSIPVVLRTEESGVPSMGSYYQGGGFLSSLAAIQSLQPPQPFNQHVSLGGGGGGGGDLGGSSNLGMLQGFNVHVPSFGPNQQTNQQRQFYQMGADRDKTSTIGLIYPPDQQERLMMQSSRPSASSSSQHNWHQNFINDTKPNVSDTTIWSTVSTSTGSHSNNTTATTAGSSSTSLNPNQWPPHFPGYGAPP